MKVFQMLMMLVFFVSFMFGCQTAEVQKPVPYGAVGPAGDAAISDGEWVPVRIVAKGGGAPPPNAVNQAQARLMAERAAKVDAMRNILEESYGVVIRSHTTVKDFVTENDTIKAKVNAYIKGAKVIDTRYMNDGSVEVTMEVVLDYEFRRIFP